MWSVRYFSELAVRNQENNLRNIFLKHQICYPRMVLYCQFDLRIRHELALEKITLRETVRPPFLFVDGLKMKKGKTVYKNIARANNKEHSCNKL